MAATMPLKILGTLAKEVGQPFPTVKAVAICHGIPLRRIGRAIVIEPEAEADLRAALAIYGRTEAAMGLVPAAASA